MNNKEKAVLEKVRNLLAKTQENGASEAEALTAANMAQKLLAKYNLEMEMLSISDEDEDIDGEYIDYTRNWQAILAHIVAKNMCCRGFTCSSTKSFCIVGDTIHRKTAIETAKMLITACKAGYKKFLKESGYSGRLPKMEQTYCLSFCEGVNSALEKQCRALALVIPEKVNKYAEEKYNLKPRKIDTTVNNNHAAQSQGRADGYSAMSTKQLKQ